MRRRGPARPILGKAGPPRRWSWPSRGPSGFPPMGDTGAAATAFRSHANSNVWAAGSGQPK